MPISNTIQTKSATKGMLRSDKAYYVLVLFLVAPLETMARARSAGCVILPAFNRMSTTTMSRLCADSQKLAEFLDGCKNIVAVTGAGISTESGIPDYRSPTGSFSRGFKPMVHDEFISKPVKRSRYWARSMLGYHRFSRAQPNKGHRALAALENDVGTLGLIISQNVDGLHQRAGSKRVLDLHGRNDRIVCLSCGLQIPRRGFQAALEELNQQWVRQNVPATTLEMFSDGDVDLENAVFEDFAVPSCKACGGVLKPAVVFYGDVVPSAVVQEAFAAVDAADAVLVAGTSLMVYSSWRFVLDAAKKGKPILVVNQGQTRAEREGVPHLKIEKGCGEVLEGAVQALLGSRMEQCEGK